MTAWRHIWLIAHNDLRLTYRDRLEGRKRAWLGMGVLGLLLLLLIAASIAIFHFVRPPANLYAEGFLWAFVSFFMFGAAVNQTVVVLCERNDLDLLLSAPVAPRVVLLGRLVSIVLASGIGSSLIVIPLGIGAATGRGASYLAVFPTALVLMVITSTLAISTALGLVRLVGVKHARTTVQILGGLMGALGYLVSQLHHFPTEQYPSLVKTAERAAHFFSLETVAAAGSGALVPFGWLCLGAGLMLVLTYYRLERVFLHLAQGGGEKTNRRGPIRIHPFDTSLTRATVRKDLRLIRRDPLLLSQLLPSVMYIAPAFLVMTRADGLHSLGPIALVVAVQTSGVLALVAAHGEEAWDLILASPTAELRLRVGKAIAGALLPIGSAWFFALIIAWQGDYLEALATGLVASANAAAAAWLSVAKIEPRPREQIMAPRARRSGGIGSILWGIFLISTGGIGLALLGNPKPVVWVSGLALLAVNLIGVACCLVLVEPRQVSLESARVAPAS